MAAEAPQNRNVHRTARLRGATRIDSRAALGDDLLEAGGASALVAVTTQSWSRAAPGRRNLLRRERRGPRIPSYGEDQGRSRSS